MSDKFRTPEKGEKHKQPKKYRNSFLYKAKQNSYFSTSTNLSGNVKKVAKKSMFFWAKKKSPL